MKKTNIKNRYVKNKSKKIMKGGQSNSLSPSKYRQLNTEQQKKLYGGTNPYTEQIISKKPNENLDEGEAEAVGGAVGAVPIARWLNWD